MQTKGAKLRPVQYVHIPSGRNSDEQQSRLRDSSGSVQQTCMFHVLYVAEDMQMWTGQGRMCREAFLRLIVLKILVCGALDMQDVLQKVMSARCVSGYRMCCGCK